MIVNDPDAIHAAYGKRVLRARKMAGMTQTELADRLGVSRPSVANAENGRQLHTVAQAHAVAEATGVDVRWLVSGQRPDDPFEMPRVDPDAGLLHEARVLRALLTLLRGWGYRIDPPPP